MTSPVTQDTTEFKCGRIVRVLNILKLQREKLIERILELFNREVFSYGTRTLKTPQTSADILFYDDEEFFTCFNMKRSTFRCIVRSTQSYTTIIDGVRRKIRYKLGEDNETLYLIKKNRTKLPTTELICFCIWYLTHPTCSINEMVKIFRLKNLIVANSELERGFKMIARLADQVVTSCENFRESAGAYKKDFDLENVVGSIGHKKFFTTDKRVIMLHVICNAQFLFTAIDTTPDMNIGLALSQSKLMSELQKLPEEYYLVSDFTYNFPKPNGVNILNPQIKISYEEPASNKHIYNGLLIPDLCFQHVLKRFPRLNAVHEPIPEIFLSALVMHNFIIWLEDIDELIPFREGLSQ